MTTPCTAAGPASTSIGRLVRRWLTDSCPVPGAGEEETATRCDRLADAVQSLGILPAQDWTDTAAKLSVLTARLRQTASAADLDAMLSVLLAESVRDDVVRLSVAHSSEAP